MEPGTYVRPHRHPHTFELLTSLSGRFVVLTFDDAGNVTERVVLGEECKVLEMAAGTWHAVLSMDKGGVIFEVKYGGYQPVSEQDAAPWAPAENAPGTAELDPLPAKAVFVTASDGGVYDPATHTVTWSYDKWFWQNPIESTVTVKYPEGTVTLDDTVTNKATITAEVMNDPKTVVSKSSEITHGFAERKVGGRIMKTGNDYQYQVRGGLYPWRFAGINSGNTTLHFRWEDTLPCTWSTQDAKAAGDSCDKPTMVSPYRFTVFSKSGYEENGGWTLEYWTNKGNHETVNYTKTTGLTLPDGEWITRFTIDTDAVPGSSPQAWLHGTAPADLPTTEPADFASHYNPVLPPEKYYSYVASPDYVRFQNCATGTVTDKDTGTVVTTSDELCSWMRVRDEFPSVQVYKSARTNPVVVGKPASFFINGTAKPKNEGGTPTPFTIVDLLPEGFDVDDASAIVPREAIHAEEPRRYPLRPEQGHGRDREELQQHRPHPHPLERSGPGRGQPVLDLQREHAGHCSGWSEHERRHGIHARRRREVDHRGSEPAQQELLHR